MHVVPAIFAEHYKGTPQLHPGLLPTYSIFSNSKIKLLRMFAMALCFSRLMLGAMGLHAYLSGRAGSSVMIMALPWWDRSNGALANGWLFSLEAK